MPRTRIGNAWPMANMAMKEKPDIRFSTVDAVAKRGALTLKNATVPAKNNTSAAEAKRIFTSTIYQQRGDRGMGHAAVSRAPKSTSAGRVGWNPRSPWWR